MTPALPGFFDSSRIGARVPLGSRVDAVACWFCCGAGLHSEGSGLMPCARCDGTGAAHLGETVVSEALVNRLRHFATWGE